MLNSPMGDLKLDNSWKKLLLSEFEKPYMQELKKFLLHEAESGRIIFPKGSDIFSALNLTSFDDVKVVVIGQDPYHGPGQAHGLCFSVNKSVPPPPSLKNIFKELQTDVGVPRPSHGCLESWAHQGVLLLNAVLTVEQGKAGSHHNHGWEIFTDKIIELLNHEKKNLVFILWGSPAQKKAAIVDPKRHFIIKSVHPSPLSAHRGFLGSKPFSKTNQYLKSQGITEINWNIE